jgi:hypothetical protein
MYPPQLTVVLLLRDFGFLNQINVLSTSSSINDRYLLRDFSDFTLYFPPECSIPRIPYMVPRVHFHIKNCRSLQDIGDIKSQPPQISGVNPSRVSDPLTPFLLDPMVVQWNQSLSSMYPLIDQRTTYVLWDQ